MTKVDQLIESLIDKAQLWQCTERVEHERECDDARKALRAYLAQPSKDVRAERDAALAEVAALTAERDALTARLRNLQAEFVRCYDHLMVLPHAVMIDLPDWDGLLDAAMMAGFNPLDPPTGAGEQAGDGGEEDEG